MPFNSPPFSIAAPFLLVHALIATPCFADPPRRADADEQQRQHLANLARISAALRGFEKKHGHFPERVIRSDDGKPLLSWRVALLPFLNHADLHRQFRLNEPWNSAHNQKLIEQMPNVFQVGSHSDQDKNADAGYTHAVAPIMKGSLWEDHGREPRSVYDIQDGTAWTLAVFAAPDTSAVLWTKPDDVEVNKNTAGRDLFGDRQQCLITTLDGARYRIDRSTSNEHLAALITVNGGEEIDWKNYIPGIKTTSTKASQHKIRQWTFSLADNTTDEILAKRLARKPDVTYLMLNRTQVTDAGLHHLQGLPALEKVVLNASQATDEGLKHLSAVTTLKSLDLQDGPVTDAGLQHVAKLTNLKKLNLKRTGITDTGLAHLTGLVSLEELVLSKTRVTDAGLEHLRGLNNLTRLVLNDIDITDRGLQSLQYLTDLEALFLGRTRIEGPGLEHLTGMQKLETLFLNATQVSDDSLPPLVDLTRLDFLQLYHTRVTKEGVKEMKTAMQQKCYVAVKPFDPDQPTSMSFGVDGSQHSMGEIRKGIWKLYARSNGSVALFDLSVDLLERNDLSEKHPEVVKQLLGELRDWVARKSNSRMRSEWLAHQP